MEMEIIAKDKTFSGKQKMNKSDKFGHEQLLCAADIKGLHTYSFSFH